MVSRYPDPCRCKSVGPWFEPRSRSQRFSVERQALRSMASALFSSVEWWVLTFGKYRQTPRLVLCRVRGQEMLGAGNFEAIRRHRRGPLSVAGTVGARGPQDDGSHPNLIRAHDGRPRPESPSPRGKPLRATPYAPCRDVNYHSWDFNEARVRLKVSRLFSLEHRPKTSQWLGRHPRWSVVPCRPLQFRYLPLRKDLRRRRLHPFLDYSSLGLSWPLNLA